MRRALQIVPIAIFALAVQLPVHAKPSAGGPKYFYWVDVRSALIATAEGKKVAEEIDAERASTDAELSLLERSLADQQIATRKNPTKTNITEYEKKATLLEEALTRAEIRLLALESSRIQTVADDVREVIAELNAANKHIRLLEIDRHAPINIPAECNATEWLLGRLEKPGKKPLAKRTACSIKFFMYVDVDRLKVEMKSTADAQREMEALRDERLREINPVMSSTATPLTRFELFLRYTEIEKNRRSRELKNEAVMTTAATEFVGKTAKPMKGVVFLGGVPQNGTPKLSPSCDVTGWLIQLEQGRALMEDVARECKCVWLNRKGTKLRIARGCDT